MRQRTQRGQSIVEFSLLLVLTAAIGLLAMTMLGVPLRNLISRAGAAINTAAEAEPVRGSQ
ncbi:MAG TPA: hypothetical protein VNQ79_15825 [Blastocatellia bacterium]|nr:hypothetical protein [Blastocatellia bacterium]